MRGRCQSHRAQVKDRGTRRLSRRAHSAVRRSRRSVRFLPTRRSACNSSAGFAQFDPNRCALTNRSESRQGSLRAILRAPDPKRSPDHFPVTRNSLDPLYRQLSQIRKRGALAPRCGYPMRLRHLRLLRIENGAMPAGPSLFESPWRKFDELRDALSIALPQQF